MGRKYGTKIKHSRSIYKRRKSTLRKVVEWVITLLILGGLVFVGYAVAKPLSDFLANNNSSDSSSDTPSAWTPPETTSNSETDTTEPIDTTTPEPEKPTVSGSGAVAPETALASKAALEKYLTSAKDSGYSSVVFQLKDETGILKYKSSIASIKDDTTINAGKLTLAEIVSACETAGITPIAEINTLKDCTTPTVISEFGYEFADGSWAWYDAALENGGKPWANPKNKAVSTYIGALANEITKSGIGTVILKNTIYPAFSNYDFGILSADIQAADRYKQLLTVVNAAKTKAEANKGAVYTEISAKQLVEIGTESYLGTAEIFKAKDSLTDIPLIITYNKAEMNGKMVISDKSTVKLDNDAAKAVTAVFTQVLKQTGELKVIPCIDSEGLSDSDISAITKALEKLGFDNYFIK